MALQLLPLALGSALYPTLLAAVVLILGQPDPRWLLFAYVGGALLVSLLAGFAIVGPWRDPMSSARPPHPAGGSDRRSTSPSACSPSDCYGGC